jgi:hypothetical protein
MQVGNQGIPAQCQFDGDPCTMDELAIRSSLAPAFFFYGNVE